MIKSIQHFEEFGIIKLVESGGKPGRLLKPIQRS